MTEVPALPAGEAPPADEFRMSLAEHLTELRTRLVRVTLSVLLLGGVSLVFAREVYGFLMRPVGAWMVASRDDTQNTTWRQAAAPVAVRTCHPAEDFSTLTALEFSWSRAPVASALLAIIRA